MFLRGQWVKATFLLIVLLVAGILFTGCGGSNDKQATESNAGTEETGKTEEKTTGGSTERISIATGGTGGTYYPYGGTMADIINKNVNGLEATAEVTGASVENARLIDSGESQLALLMNDVVYLAVNGQGAFKDKIELRTLVEMYPNVLHVVSLKGKGVSGIYDLKGRKVSVGAPGSGTETMTSEILGALDISYDDFEVHRLSFSENTQALRDGVIEVGIWSVGAPTSSIMDLATTHDMQLTSFTEQEVKQVLDQKPYYNGTTLPAGTYDKQAEDVTTLAVWNTVAVHKNMPEETAYKIVKALFENVDDLVKVYPGAKYTTPENLVNNAVAPLHPGAVKYLKEINIEIPERLIPPELK